MLSSECIAELPVGVQTSAVTVITSPHGLQRRIERKIGIRDLKAAVKHGTKEPGFPCPRTGELRWLYTFADVVYVTDESSKREITSWPAPAAGMDLQTVTVTQSMRNDHEQNLMRISRDASSWTSHTVAVVDQSGSMRNTDLEDGATRSDAVWLTLAMDFVARRLESGEACGTDVFSLVLMSHDSTVAFRHRPVDWILYNDIILYLRTAMPKSAGNYFPALDAAEKLLLSNEHGSCALLLLFLSDGKPSDQLPRNASIAMRSGFHTTPSIKYNRLVHERIGTLASRFGRRLTVATIGFGGAREDFSVLTTMANVSRDYGSMGVFQAPALTVESLGNAMTSLTASLTQTKAELTHLGGATTQRTVRSMLRESRHALDDLVLSGDWYHYRESEVLRVVKFDSENGWIDQSLDPLLRGVAMKRNIFGEGAERMVRKLRWVGEREEFVGPMLVAKESRFVEDMHRDGLIFHRLFCQTQVRAHRLAEKFNERLAKVPGVTELTPRISFLECNVYVVMDINQGRLGLLVEKMLDPKRYMKWNSNCGYVAGQEPAVSESKPQMQLPQLFEIQEEDEEDDSDTECDGTFEHIKIAAEDIPQAFTHFTYRHSQRKMLVCDLQGVLDKNSTPPLFELTDPVIHYRSYHGRKHVYGRTDQGLKGMHSFFKTHKCSELCRALRRTW
eukprot:CAMPEP_0114246224 /NCGR_PEP_ID=MMETSP0058-20121206/12339_1 /TAXON_ID=36894 /ORGANISM="Pyramimonas parkeae, CCMP726" /LENGTH=673 /DNA_ID=CAMNT_0001359377 /DNA_START=223 /DNA_END=2241 /DNA_ORIENTATION=-